MRSLPLPLKSRLLAAVACSAVTCSALPHAESATPNGAEAPPTAVDRTEADRVPAEPAATESAATEPAAAEPAAADAASASLEPASPAPRSASDPARSLLIAAIDAALEREALLVRELQSQLAHAPDAMAALAIQRQIDARKQQTEIAILELQLEHARSNGRNADAEQLDATLQQLRQPQSPRRAVERRSPHQD